MDSILNEQSVNAVEESKQSQLVPFIASLKDCDRKVMLIPTKETPLAEEPSGSTTISPISVNVWLTMQSNSLQGFRDGNPNEDLDAVLEKTFKESFIIKWGTYPFVFTLMGVDDQDLFWSRLIQRELMKKSHPKWFVHFTDALDLLDMVWRYLKDLISF